MYLWYFVLVSTNTKNTLFDISCPDPAIQARFFEGLLKFDKLSPKGVLMGSKKPTTNRFVVYGRGYHEILSVVKEIALSTNPIHISNGLLSEFFIEMEDLDRILGSNDPTNAYIILKKDILDSINIVHIHLRSMPGNDGRRMALSVLRKTVNEYISNERWIVFENSDIDDIAKKIEECIATARQSSE